MRAFSSALLLLVFTLSGQAYADHVAYGERLTLSTTCGAQLAHHEHNWDTSSWDARLAMITGSQDPFTPENDYAHVRLSAQSAPDDVVTVPSPAFTWIGFSSDCRFLIGLSNIKLTNPYQIVVFALDGAVVAKKHIAPVVACLSPDVYTSLKQRYPRKLLRIPDEPVVLDDKVLVDYQRFDMPRRLGHLWDKLYRYNCEPPWAINFSESVTNSVWWYDERLPEPWLVLEDGNVTHLSIRDRRGERVLIPLQTASVLSLK